MLKCNAFNINILGLSPKKWQHFCHSHLGFCLFVCNVSVKSQKQPAPIKRAAIFKIGGETGDLNRTTNTVGDVEYTSA